MHGLRSRGSDIVRVGPRPCTSWPRKRTRARPLEATANGEPVDRAAFSTGEFAGDTHLLDPYDEHKRPRTGGATPTRGLGTTCNGGTRTVNAASQNPGASEHPGPDPRAPIRTYLVKSRVPPDIVCPAWCTASTKDHLEDLASHDGAVMHRGDRRALGTAGLMTVSPIAVCLADGSSDPDDPGLHLDLTRDGDAVISADEALAVAEDLTAFVHQLSDS